MTLSSDRNTGNAALPSDRDLLRRFIHDGDEASFAAIVERHAALVMSVCQRVVGQLPDAEDVFQATFFALSQRPVSIHECRSLSGWLYSVAWRASVRMVRLRKRIMTQPLPDQIPAAEPDPLDVIAQANDLATLDEELNQLPQKYRDVLVMSYFAQQTNQEIADQLNESKGAIDGRIRDARRMLRVRLARRGVEVGVLAVATACVQSSASAVCPELIQKTISLGATGITAHEFSVLNAAEVSRMKLLTSTGMPLMSKTGLTIAAGLVLATGFWGMAHLAAFQDVVGEGSVAGHSILDGRTEASDASGVELNGRTEITSSAGPFADGEATASALSAVATPPTVAAEATVSKPRRSLTGATAEFSRSSERAAERQLNEMMRTERVGKMECPGDNALSDILEQLAKTLSAFDGSPMVFKPDVVALEDVNIATLDDVMIRDIDIPEGAMTVGSALDYILTQTDPKLTWIAKDELLLITTIEAAESDENMFLRSYDISRLRDISQLTVTAWTGDGGGMGGGGGFFNLPFTPTQLASGGGGLGGGGRPGLQKTVPSKPDTDKSGFDDGKQQVIITWEAGLIRTIQDMTGSAARWYDVDGEGGRMSIAGNRLIVRQSRKGHEQVVAVLEQLEMAADDAAEEL